MKLALMKFQGVAVGIDKIIFIAIVYLIDKQKIRRSYRIDLVDIP